MGKSWLLTTMPGPRLIADTEGRTKYIPGKKVLWDPRHEPQATEPDVTTIVKVKDYATVDAVTNWLKSGKHPFKSFGVDSLTEAQKRKKDAMTGNNQMQLQHWGELLRALEGLARGVRDLTDPDMTPNALLCAIVVSGTQEKNGSKRPLLEGAIALNIPYYFDLNGYLYTAQDPDNPGQLVRALQIQPFNNIVAKDGTDLLTQHYGHTIYRPNFTEMLEVLNK